MVDIVDPSRNNLPVPRHAGAIALVGILLVSGIGLMGNAGARPLAPAAVGGLGSSLGSLQIAAAERSLQSGAAPLGGGPGSCTSQGTGSSARCALVGSPSMATLASLPGPPPRAVPGLAYDAKDGYVVLFGGCRALCSSATTLNDTWTYAHGAWKQLALPVAPSPRWNPGMAYDPADAYVVLFGGFDGRSTYLNDTWTFTAGTWTHVVTPTAPSPRRPGAMATDPAAGGEVVLFGGQGSPVRGSATLLGDTWTFHAGVWTQQAPTTHPPARKVATMAFDAGDSALILFGGYGSSGYLADTWRFANGTWLHVPTRSSPPARAAASIAYDPAEAKLVLFGGAGTFGTLADTWTFHLAAGLGVWTGVATQVAPTQRDSQGMTWDGKDLYVLVFGGQNCAFGTACPFSFGDTWSSSGGDWNLLSSTAPPPRAVAGLSWDSTDGYVLLFGGCSAACQGSPEVYNDTWTFLNGTWTRLAPSVSPASRWDPGLADDASDGVVVLFGGFAGTSAFFGDTWTYTAGVWTHLTPASSPSARRPAAMAYDPVDGYVVLFGGQTASGLVQDTWTFSAGAWTSWAIAGPSARKLAAAAFDVADGYLVLFGGYGTAGSLADTWTFVAGTWTHLTPTSSPSAREGASSAYDAAAGVVVLAGGAGASGASLADTWTFSAGAWTHLTPAPSPPAREAADMTADPTDGITLLFGGQSCTFGAQCSFAFGDQWSYASGVWTKF